MAWILRKQRHTFVHLLEKALVPRTLCTKLFPPRAESHVGLGLEAGVFRGRLLGPAQDEHASVLQRVGDRGIGREVGADGREPPRTGVGKAAADGR